MTNITCVDFKSTKSFLNKKSECVYSIGKNLNFKNK